MNAAFPRVVVGLSQMVLYDVSNSKPKHGKVEWAEGVWSHLHTSFQSCKDRGCLLLMVVEPITKRQTYQHGDPGPVLVIDPEKGEFPRVQGWLRACHEREDARAAATPTETPKKEPRKFLFWRRVS